MQHAVVRAPEPIFLQRRVRPPGKVPIGEEQQLDDIPGGLGPAPGANIGTEAAVFEPVHGSAPKYAGQDKANPTAMILSGALMLRHLGYPEAAQRVEDAVRDVIAEGISTTYDLGGPAGTAAYADAIIERLVEGAAAPAAAPLTNA